MPRFAIGLVEKPTLRVARFVRLAIPAKTNHKPRGALWLALEKLVVGGDAYIVPIANAGDRTRATARTGSVARLVGRKTGRTFAIRSFVLDGELVVGVWRIK